MNCAKNASLTANWIPQMVLRHRNTLGFHAIAQFACEVSSASQLPEIFNEIHAQHLPWQVLGGGSNVILPSHLAGVTLLMNILGQTVVKADQDHTWLAVGAGVQWHALVAWTLAHDLPGLENLALIPGTVGAAPIQNIGAYGVEIGQYVDSVQAFDALENTVVTLPHAACQFAYRDSYFKQHPKRFIITQVVLKIPQAWQARLHYADLQKHFASAPHAPNAQDIFAAVCSIRAQKLPDPNVIGNVGSFFQNPLVEQAHYERLLAQYPALVSFPDLPGKRKLAAGWLIDHCGFKGKQLGSVGVYEHQALVLVNHGGGTAHDILQLAAAIQEKVSGDFGVQLAIEPTIF